MGLMYVRLRSLSEFGMDVGLMDHLCGIEYPVTPLAKTTKNVLFVG